MWMGLVATTALAATTEAAKLRAKATAKAVGRRLPRKERPTTAKRESPAQSMMRYSENERSGFRVTGDCP